MAWNEKEQIAFVTTAKRADGDALEDHLMPWAILGKERLSRLYEYHVAFTVGDARTAGDGVPTSLEDADIQALLHAPCAVALGGQEGDNLVHGVLASVERTDTGVGAGGYSYVAKLVPTAWLLTLARSNRVFLGKTIVDVVTEVLGGYGLQPWKKDTDTGYFEIRASAKEAREYVVQFEETDWDFIQRWLEREGLFYWFEPRKRGEKLVISDKNPGVTGDRGDLRYDNHDPPARETVSHWHVRHRRTPARVALLDYNYRSPDAFLKGKAEVDEKQGFGTVFSYGEHFKNAAEGERIAAMRADRQRLAALGFDGRVNFPRLRAGYAFEMKDHAHEGSYLVTSIEHRVGARIDVTPGTPWEGERVTIGERMGYGASFDCIPHDAPYRPERVTPWPRIDGVLNAHVEEDTDGKYAQLDGEGRYKIKLPFDLSGHTGVRASHWVRMAESYSGDGYGAHLPLHKGAEVLLAHVCGDPDRPVIVGAAPNPATRSPVTDKNSTQSVIRTASGIHVEMEDLEA